MMADSQEQLRSHIMIHMMDSRDREVRNSLQSIETSKPVTQHTYSKLMGVIAIEVAILPSFPDVDVALYSPAHSFLSKRTLSIRHKATNF